MLIRYKNARRKPNVIYLINILTTSAINGLKTNHLYESIGEVIFKINVV